MLLALCDFVYLFGVLFGVYWFCIGWWLFVYLFGMFPFCDVLFSVLIWVCVSTCCLIVLVVSCISFDLNLAWDVGFSIVVYKGVCLVYCCLLVLLYCLLIWFCWCVDLIVLWLVNSVAWLLCYCGDFCFGLADCVGCLLFSCDCYVYLLVDGCLVVLVMFDLLLWLLFCVFWLLR